MNDKKFNCNLTIIIGIGIMIVVVIILFFTFKGGGMSKKSDSDKEKLTTNKYDYLGIKRTFSEKENEHIDAIIGSMEYLTQKYGSGAYIFARYEFIDDLSEYIYVVDSSDDSQMIVIRTNFNGEYSYRETYE